MYNNKYICTSCDRTYGEEDAEVIVKKEYMGECHGAPAYEEIEYICCPYCGSDQYEETTMEDNAAEHTNLLTRENFGNADTRNCESSRHGWLRMLKTKGDKS